MTSPLKDQLTASLTLDDYARRYCLTDMGDGSRKVALANLIGEVVSVAHKFALHSHDPLALALDETIDQLNNVREEVLRLKTEPEDDGYAGLRETLADQAWATGR